MIVWLTGLVGRKLAVPVLIGAGLLLALALFGLVRSCSADRVTEQAEQTSRSGEAIADAAQNAVATVVNANEREASVDAIVAQAAKEIDNAPDPATARAATLRAVCLLAEYRNDPACRVR